MAKDFVPLRFSFLLILSFILCATEARPFNIFKSHAYASGGIGGFLDGLSLGVIKSSSPSHNLLGGVKDSGPSPGQGHTITDGQTLERIKDSDLSSGQRHTFTDGQTLGGVKHSGPSPGQGHTFTNGQTLGRVKQSSPSPSQGHAFTNAQIVGGIKDSGPTSGKGHAFTGAKTPGGIKNSPGEGHNHVVGTYQ